MRIIRLILGKLILFLNWAFPPKGIKRDLQQQAEVNQQTIHLELYQYRACPFCVKVRRAMKRQSLSIETRDMKRSYKLLAGGGHLKVPCLRVEERRGQVEWIYESSDIIQYLEGRFVGPRDVSAS